MLHYKKVTFKHPLGSCLAIYPTIAKFIEMKTSSKDIVAKFIEIITKKPSSKDILLKRKNKNKKQMTMKMI
jgi:hypothetical protein